MNRLQRIAAFASTLALTFGIGLGAAHAVTITSGCAAVNNFCTFDELFNNNATITVDGALFDEFSMVFDGDLTQMTAEAAPFEALNPGLLFKGNTQILGSDPSLNNLMDYDVTALGGLLFVDASMLLNSGTVLPPDGSILIANAGGFDTNLSVSLFPGDMSGIFDSEDFAPLGFLLIGTDFNVFGPASLNEWTVRYSQTPEPTSAMIFATGFAVFALTNRKRRTA